MPSISSKGTRGLIDHYIINVEDDKSHVEGATTTQRMSSRHIRATQKCVCA